MLVRDFGIARTFFNTRSTVAPGIYRSSHPWPYQIRQAARAGVRTVINLRGYPHNRGSFALEREACEQSGLRLVQFRMKSRDLPSADDIHAFARLLDSIDYPVLMHCKSGADRVGFASALALMLRERQPPEIATQQLSLRYGHVRQAKTGILDFFLARYTEHFQQRGTSLLDWCHHHYDRKQLRSAFGAQWWASFIVDRVLRRE